MVHYVVYINILFTLEKKYIFCNCMVYCSVKYQLDSGVLVAFFKSFVCTVLFLFVCFVCYFV